jgi:sec-independent protein translocase protein TatA
MLGFIQNLGAMEIFLILLIVLLLFGAKRLPELSRSMGKSLREFKKATSEVEDDIRSAMNEDPNDDKKRAQEKKQAEEKKQLPQHNAEKTVESHETSVKAEETAKAEQPEKV